MIPEIPKMSKQVAPPVVPGISTFRYTKRNPPADPTESFAGKTVLITGANAGLGLEAAIKFARLGASNLILGIRSLEKGRAAKELIEKASGCKSTRIHLFALEMASHKSVEKFAKQVSEQFTHIHAAVLNAGMVPTGYQATSDGWEITLQVNSIGTVQLSLLLVPKLKATGLSTGRPAILEIVSSHGYLLADLRSFTTDGKILDKLNDKAAFGLPIRQYFRSKLLVTWSMSQIASRVNPAEVIVIASCPGLCRSTIGRDFTWLAPIMSIWYYLFARQTEEGGRTLVSGALQGPEAHGKLWTNDYIYE